MPNWCNNTITIQGPTETLKPLWDEANQEDSGLLQAMVPMPKELNDTTSPSDGDNWYNWRLTNWGCKWDVDMDGLEFTDNSDGTSAITGGFSSPWSPPVTAYETFSADMDNCHIEAYYEEGGMDFAGRWDTESGDDFLEDISDYARQVCKTNESGSDLYDQLDEFLELTESRREYIEEEIAEENSQPA